MATAFPFAEKIVEARNLVLDHSNEKRSVGREVNPLNAATTSEHNPSYINAMSTVERKQMAFKHLLEAPDRPGIGQIFFFLSNPDQYIQMLRTFDHDIVFERMHRFLTGHHGALLEIPDSVMARATTAEILGAALKPLPLPGDKSGTQSVLIGGPVVSEKLLSEASAGKEASTPTPSPILEAHPMLAQLASSFSGKKKSAAVDASDSEGGEQKPPALGESLKGEAKGLGESSSTSGAVVPGAGPSAAPATYEEPAQDVEPYQHGFPLVVEYDSVWLSDITAFTINDTLFRWWDGGGSAFCNNEEMLRLIVDTIATDVRKGRITPATAHILLQELSLCITLDENVARLRIDVTAPVVVPKFVGLLTCGRANVAAVADQNMIEGCEHLIDSKGRCGWEPTYKDYAPLFRLLPKATDEERQALADCIRYLEGVSALSVVHPALRSIQKVSLTERKSFPLAAKVRFTQKVLVPYFYSEVETLATRFWKFWVLYLAVFLTFCYVVNWYRNGGRITINWKFYNFRPYTDEEIGMNHQERKKKRLEEAKALGDWILEKRIHRMREDQVEREQTVRQAIKPRGSQPNLNRILEGEVTPEEPLTPEQREAQLFESEQYFKRSRVKADPGLPGYLVD
jgi:hypothetical protein